MQVYCDFAHVIFYQSLTHGGWSVVGVRAEVLVASFRVKALLAGYFQSSCLASSGVKDTAKISLKDFLNPNFKICLN